MAPDTSCKSYAELEVIIAAATARKAEMYDAELTRLVTEIEGRCATLGVSPQKHFTLFRKGSESDPASTNGNE